MKYSAQQQQKKISIWYPSLITRNSSRARQPLSRVNVTELLRRLLVKIENIYLFKIIIIKKHGNVFKNGLCPNFLLLPKRSELPNFFLWGGHQPPPPPPCPYAYVLNKCLYGEAPSRGPTPYPLIYYFSLKRYPFRISSVDKLYPFHIPCLALCIPFNCCKCTVFSIGINHKSRTFSRLSPFGPFHGPKWQISLPFYILQLVKSLHFHVPEAWEWYPFGAEPLRIGHQREYPPARITRDCNSNTG